MADDAPSVGVNVTLNYVEAAKSLEAFKELVGAVEGNGAALDGTVGALRKIGADLGKTLDGFRVMTAEMDAAAARGKNLGDVLNDVGEKEESAGAKARQAAQQQIKDAQYLNSTLEQRTAILSRLSAAMTTMQRAGDGTIPAQGQKQLDARFGQLAQTEHANGQLPAMANATAEIEKQFELRKQMSTYEAAMAQNSDALATTFYNNQMKAAAAQKKAADDKAAEDQKQADASRNYLNNLEIQQQKVEQRAADAAAKAAKKEDDRIRNANNNVNLKEIAAEQAAQEAADAARLKAIQTQVAFEGKQYENFLKFQAGKEAAAARDIARAQAESDASNNFLNKLEIAAMNQEQKTAAEQALAAETARISIYEFQERTLEKQLATLMKIRAIEASSIADGSGNLSQNASLTNRVGAKYGAGALTAYQAGQLPVIQAQVDAQDLKPKPGPTGGPADVSGSEARRAAAKAESEALRDLNGAARGLAGPSGLLYLTYGSMLPLAGGAALASGVGASMKQGGQFAENMAFVRQLSTDAAPSLDALNQQIQGISDNLLNMGANGRFGAVQLTQSMRTLAQAGFGPQQSTQILPAVTNLSTIGETTPDKAALSIAGSLSAFNLGADQANRVADVLALSAAKSQTGVAELMESMKQASSVAQDYGATIEETSAVLTLLAQRNVTGSAAGTSFRNMLVDLAGRTPKATKALQELGVTFYDQTTGRARDTVAVLGDLISKLSGMNQQMQNFYGKQIFDERGLKAFSAVAGAGQVNFSGLVGQLKGAGDNGGFAQRSADQLNTTPLAEYEKAFNSLQSTLIEGFNLSEGSMKEFAKAMQAGFQSDEFKGFVSDISLGVAGVANFVVAAGPMLETVTKLAIVYGTYKVAVGLGTVATGLWNTVAGATTAVTGSMSAAITTAKVAQLEYSELTAIGATRMEALGGAATYAGISMRGFTAALGPIALLATAAYVAYELFSSSAEASTAKLAINMQDLRSADSFKYDDLKQSYTGALDGMLSATGKYSSDSVKSLDDVITKMKGGQQSLADFTKKVQGQQGADNLTAKQYLIDQEANYYKEIEDQAVRHYSGAGDDPKKLAALFVTLAAEKNRIDEQMTDLMATRAAETAAAQIKAANDSQDGWIKFFSYMGSAQADVDAGRAPKTPGELQAESTDTTGSSKAIDESVAKLIKANESGTRLTPEDFGGIKALTTAYANQPGADPTRVQANKNDIDMQQQIRGAQVDKNYQDAVAKANGTIANGQKPDHPKKADRSDYNASKQSLDLAKEETAQFENQLKLRKQLSLFTSEDAFAHERDLKVQQENAQYDADRAKMELDIAKAQKSGNADAVQTMQENLSLLTTQHEHKLQNLELDYQADALQRDMNKALQQINVTMTARTTIMRAMTDMYGSTAGFQTAELSRQAELATITKARYDQAKEMESLSDAPAEVRALATEQRRWELANDIYKIRQEEQKLLFDNATSSKDIAQAYLNSIDETIAKLKSQQTTFSDASVTGLANGTQDAWKGLFAYIKNPTDFKQQNNGQAFGLGTAASTVGNGIFDSISSSLANSMTTSMMSSIRDLMKSTGLVSNADAAREEAQKNIAVNTQNTALALGANGGVILALNNIYSAIATKGVGLGGAGGYTAGQTTEGGQTFAVPGTGANLDGTSGPGGMAKVADATQSATGAMADLGKQTGSTFSFMGQNATQMFGLMYMGANAFATGGIKAFERFAAATIVQLLAVYAIQQLVTALSSASGGGVAPGGAQAMPVNMGSSITMTPLAGGGVPKMVPGYAMGEGSVDSKGILHGPGGPKEDKIRAALSPGEGILNAAAVQFYGKDVVDQMNKRQMRRFAEGGTVNPFAAGSGAISNGNSYNVEQNFYDSGKDKGDGASNDKGAAQLFEQMKAAVLEVFQEQGRPGGSINVQVKQIVSGQK